MKQQSKFLLAACVAILFVLSAVADEIQLVNATGYGMSVEEAKRAGVRAAVEAVVGTLVDAETLVENDELIQDKILSYSAGMVEDVKFIGTPKKNSAGLVMVRVQVKVKKTELAERVQKNIRTSFQVDGESLYQQTVFSRENQGNIQEIVKKLFSFERVQGLLRAEKSSFEVNQATGEVTVGATVEVDMPAYRQWTSEIIEKIGPVATEKCEEVVEDSDLSQLFCGDCLGDTEEEDENDFYILVNPRAQKSVGLRLGKGVIKSLKQSFPSGNGGFPYEPTLKVSLVDKQGEEIKIVNEGMDGMLARIHGDWPERCEIFPFIAHDRYFGQSFDLNSSVTVPVSFGELKPQDIRDIDRVTIEIVLE